MHTWGDLHSYQKRVHHDTVVPRALYQDLYLELKTKYASTLIAGWAEVTDPTKHVFEEMGIAAFLVALWSIHYKSAAKKEEGEGEGWKEKVKFVDVGCGNGLLTHILTIEGFKGVGLDLRARKSWPNYASEGATLREWTFDPSHLLPLTIRSGTEPGYSVITQTSSHRGYPSSQHTTTLRDSSTCPAVTLR